MTNLIMKFFLVAHSQGVRGISTVRNLPQHNATILLFYLQSKYISAYHWK